MAISVAAGAVCCSRNGEGLPPVTPEARRIVARYAADAFITAFSPEDATHRAAFTEFRGRIAASSARAELEAAWTAVPALRAKGQDFLTRKVFAKAEADGDWPGPVAAADEPAVLVAGVRDGVESFLAEGTR
ncbi:MAG: hypothetical protein ACREID_06520 [Planctomycetota bacterium]